MLYDMLFIFSTTFGHTMKCVLQNQTGQKALFSHHSTNEHYKRTSVIQILQPMKFREIRLWNKLVDLFSARESNSTMTEFPTNYFFTFTLEHDMLDHDLPPMVCWDTHESPHMPLHYTIRTRFQAYKLKHITRTYDVYVYLCWFDFVFSSRDFSFSSLVRTKRI